MSKKHLSVRLRLFFTFVIAFSGGLAALLSVPSASAATIPVTVTITRFIEIDDPDPAPLQGDGDYFARVRIGSFPAQDNRSDQVEAEDFEPFWTFTRDIDDSLDSIIVEIEIIDDDGFGNPDDLIDINPIDNVTKLSLILNLTTGGWTGDIPANQGWSQGDGDTEHSGIFEGGERGKVFFDISIFSASGDADGDGLLDGWELHGLDSNGDGTIDVDLPAMGANPRHKDLFLEFDWMPGHEPVRAEIQTLKAAFAAAPINAGGLNNPDGLPGINLWVDTGNLMEGGLLVGDNLGGGNQIPLSDICDLDASFYAAKGANFNSNRRWVFRYAISADGTNCTGGGWGELGGNDFIEYNHDAGTIMHELGHNLNLDHGGNNGDNCKPNYVSVMNYDNQFNIRQAGGATIIDFSPPRFAGGRGVAPLPALNEGNLNEATILDATDATNRFVFVNADGDKVQSALNQAVDWNGDGDTSDSGLSVNIDTADATSGRPAACMNASSNSTLSGHHDWNVISMPFRQFGDSANSAINKMMEPEPDLQELLQLEAALHTTDLAITKSDSPDPVAAGDELTYTLMVSNHGPNPADQVRVTDTLPTGVSYQSDDGGCVEAPTGTLTCNVVTIDPDESVQISITVLVAADLVYNNGGPLTITNNASVTSLAEFYEDSNTSNNSTSASTLVVAVADLEIVSFLDDDAPLDVLIGVPTDVTLEKVITNNGPSAPMDVDVSVTATASSGASVSPAAANQQALALGKDELRTVFETFTLECVAPGEQTFTFTNTIAPLDPADTDPDLSNNVAVVEVTVDCVVPVAINIRPKGFPNSTNLRSTETLAVLSTEAGEYDLPLAFDATTIQPLTVRFGLASNLFNKAVLTGASEVHNQGHIEDSYELDEKTRDRDLDMVLHFVVAQSGLSVGDTEACVKGKFTDGGNTYTFFGCDSVVIRP